MKKLLVFFFLIEESTGISACELRQLVPIGDLLAEMLIIEYTYDRLIFANLK